MKIERISDNQIKFVLNKTDLLEKNIKITELAYGSEKTQELFREMMERAYVEYGFEAENAPLMIEAIPVTVDSIMIIVTKVAGGDDIESKFNNFLPRSRDFNQFSKKDSGSEKRSEAGSDKQPRKRPRPQQPSVYVYSFKQMDDAINLSARLVNTFDGQSSMYKYNDRYFMIFDNRSSAQNYRGLENVLGEYGQKHVSGTISQHHLMEHGETIIAESAVQALAKI